MSHRHEEKRKDGIIKEAWLTKIKGVGTKSNRSLNEVSWW